MSEAKTILILHPQSEAGAGAARRLEDALLSLGAKAVLHDMTTRYDEILDVIARADTVVVWR